MRNKLSITPVAQTPGHAAVRAWFLDQAFIPDWREGAGVCPTPLNDDFAKHVEECGLAFIREPAMGAMTLPGGYVSPGLVAFVRCECERFPEGAQIRLMLPGEFSLGTVVYNAMRWLQKEEGRSR